MLLIAAFLCYMNLGPAPVHCSSSADVLVPLLRAQIRNTEINYDAFLASSTENVFSSQKDLFLVIGFSAFERKTKTLTCVFCYKCRVFPSGIHTEGVM